MTEVLPVRLRRGGQDRLLVLVERCHVGAMVLGSRDEGVGLATQRGLLSPVGITSLLVGSEYVGAVCIHHENLGVPIPGTGEGDAFPSGDHTGCRSISSLSVSCWTLVPSASITKISWS